MPATGRFHHTRHLLAALVMLGLVALQAMAASEDFHKCCHDHEPDQPCAVTLIRDGACDPRLPEPPAVPVILETPEIPVEMEAETVPALTASHLIGGVLAHGPPRGP